jgi:3-methyladenine DNA glycosylase AlkD
MITNEHMSTAAEAKKALKRKADAKKARLLQGFFKTGPGEYGEGDLFLGIVMSEQRKVAKIFSDLPFSEIRKLLRSKYHEERMVALLILVERYRRGTVREKEKIFGFYLANTRYINNWDLVDVTCHKIVGEHLVERSRAVLHRLARSKDLWERRIAVVSTFRFIYDGDFSDSLKIARALLKDEHDLIHKAVGWMLREVGKKDVRTLEGFLKKHHKVMPRTMLRYAIERLPETKRRRYMKR